MPRRRSLFRIPFLKIKINQKTIFNILGFLLIAGGVISLVSLLNLVSDEESGRILFIVKDELTFRFGILSVLVPLLLLLLSAHFFSTKKLKFIKFNTTIGSFLIFVALLGILQAGDWGKFIFDNLKLDFSTTGAVLILFIAFLIGLILFLNTSIDAFLLFVIKIFKVLIDFFRNYVFRELLTKKKPIKEGKPQELDKGFIQDKKIEINQKALDLKPAATKRPEGEMNIRPLSTSSSAWVYPSLDLLADYPQTQADRGDVKKNASVIETTLDSFGVRAQVGEINYGPTVTQYALQVARGTRLSKITTLGNDLALALAAPTGRVRIEAPIPGRSLVGIEIPNIKPEIVTLKNLLTSPLFADNPDPLFVPLGLDVSGEPQGASISKMPHVLIAGQTGAGKSVLLNSWISTFLFRTKPEELRLILVDPKRVELTLYNGNPHLLTEVIVDSDKSISALKWTIAEMEARYREFAKARARNIESYNAIQGVEKKPYIIFVIDELAALMSYAPGDAENLITKIAQMSRATGIHLVLATQRPSVDVITGLMKANIPTRIAFNVSSMIDSRVIIDMPGAEKLLGRGDLFYLPPDQAKPRRIQGPFITEKEVSQVVSFLRSQVPEVHYTTEVTEQEGGGGYAGVRGGGGEKDSLFNHALELVMQSNTASASLLQRKLSIGYARAARILDQLYEAGYVGPAEGSKPREVLRRSPDPQE